jgi:hypothetical protein
VRGGAGEGRLDKGGKASVLEDQDVVMEQMFALLVLCVSGVHVGGSTMPLWAKSAVYLFFAPIGVAGGDIGANRPFMHFPLDGAFSATSPNLRTDSGTAGFHKSVARPLRVGGVRQVYRWCHPVSDP